MCGIAGILSYDRAIEPATLRKMTDTIMHRGPDGEGHWLSDNGRVGLGHRRLSIIDLSSRGGQPMHYGKGRFTITFNGEIYNYLELKEELIAKGYRFSSDSDTEVLLALFEDKGEACLSDLDGMFAFAIWDEKKGELFCARDRFGEKPFFYSQEAGRFSFASEMKALFTIGVSKAKNYKHYYYYLLYNMSDDASDKSTTYYSAIGQLEPAHYLFVDRSGEIRKKRYWDIDLSKKIDVGIEEATKTFFALFEKAVKRRLRSDVAVGSSLSGGLDSSSIVMLIDKIRKKGQVQKTFSARFKNFEKDEGEYMNHVINNTSVDPYFVFPSAQSAWDNIEKIMWHQEEPIGSLSIAVQYEVMKAARTENVPVLLDGQGADEVLAGYWDFFEGYFLELFQKDKSAYCKEVAGFEELHGQKIKHHGQLFKWKASRPGLFSTFSELRKNLRSPDSDYFLGIHPDLVRAYKREPNPIPKSTNLKEQLNFYACRGVLGELLRYADRNSMAHSVEVRLPFLSHELVEYAFSLPNECLIHLGWTKFVLRRSMEHILPKEIAWRTDKVGYEPPQKQWERSTHFKERVQSAIEQLKKEHVLKSPRKEQYWQYLTLNMLA